MTYFKLNIKKINESISRYKELKKLCLEDANLVYRGLGYTESAWNDMSAHTFIENTKSDRYKLGEYFNYLDSLFNEIDQFKSNIDNICCKQGYKRNTINFKFDNSELSTCKKYLNNAISYLNDCSYRVNAYEFSSSFPYKYLIYDLKSEINSIKNSINSLITDITNFNNAIENEIYDSQYRMKRISNYSFNLSRMNYNWQIVNLDLKK